VTRAVRRAEIAGAGLAGLTAAVALSQRGWKVRVHEQAPRLREIGAGLYLKANGLRALGTLGVLEKVRQSGVRLERMDLHDVGTDRWLVRRLDQFDVMTVARPALYDILKDAAGAGGVELVANSRVVRAWPDGRIELDSGRELTGDLIVAADGANSVLRDGLGLLRRRRVLAEGATRLMIPRSEDTASPVSIEHWSGRLRLLVTPCSSVETYVALMGPESEQRARRLPVDTEYWGSAFPEARSVVDRLPAEEGVHHVNMTISCKAWHLGRVCVLGDAAHAQPPNLGQGAGLAIANATELALTLDKGRDAPEQLEAWERKLRARSLAIQRWSEAYGALAYHWPHSLDRFRMGMLQKLTSFGPTGSRYIWLWQGALPDMKPHGLAMLGRSRAFKLGEPSDGGTGRV